MIFDKYIILREVHKELNEQMSQLLIGFDRYTDMKGILIKGAVKAFEDALKKYRDCRNIEQYYATPDKVADFFDAVYEKFEKQIDAFFDSKVGDIQEANSFYKLKTKFLDRKLRGL